MQKIDEIQSKVNDHAKHDTDVQAKLSGVTQAITALETKYAERSAKPAEQAVNEDDAGLDDPLEEDPFGDGDGEDGEGSGSITTADGKVVPSMKLKPPWITYILYYKYNVPPTVCY